MKIEHSHLLPFPRERVWDVLLDPAVLSRVLPGVESFEPKGDDRYAVVVELGVAGVKGRYAGEVEIVEKKPLDSYRLKGQGQGAPGWAKGEALMTLVEEAGGTRVRASANVQVGGTIAGVGQRMIDGVARAMAKEFFGAIEREVGGRKQKVSTAAFGFRVFLILVRDFFGRLFGRAAAHEAPVKG